MTRPELVFNFNFIYSHSWTNEIFWAAAEQSRKRMPSSLPKSFNIREGRVKRKKNIIVVGLNESEERE